jgi:hypothetical protein
MTCKAPNGSWEKAGRRPPAVDPAGGSEWLWLELALALAIAMHYAIDRALDERRL